MDDPLQHFSTSQVSGIKFAFDPKRPSGKRVDRDLVRIGDEYVKKDGVYHMVRVRSVLG